MTIYKAGRISQVGMEANNSKESNVKVVVRVRPENKQEQDGGYKIVVRPMDEYMLVFDPKEQGSPDFYHGRRRKGRNMLKKANKDIRFAFDQVFDHNTTNEEVYENTTKGILDGLIDGYNCSVFAYGATGAGKTFSMLGTSTKPGVIFLTMMDLYSRIEDMKNEKTCEIAVSYLEVYNEQILDLLLPKGYLPVREDPQKGVIISGLSLHKPADARELLHMLEFGNQNRTQHPTDANKESSRSHAVFQVFVRQRDRTSNLSADVRVAKMSLIDLAGSERATVTTNRGARFREGANINKSLLALGNCINALASGKSKSYVPYRNSKLTRLLKDSLGGNCRTVMIAAVSPSAMSYEDTYNTLKYADRTKNIKSSLKRNVLSVDFHVTQYAKIVQDLRKEVTELKIKLTQFEEGTVVSNRRLSIGADMAFKEEITRIQSSLHSVFGDRISIRKEIMELEGSERDLGFKIYRKELSISRINTVISDSVAQEKAGERLERYVQNAKKRQNNIRNRKVAVQERMENNAARLERVENEMKLISTDNDVPEVLDLSLRCRHLEVELRDTRRQGKFLKKLGRAQQRELQSSEKLLHMLLGTVKRQFYLLKSHNMATKHIEDDFNNIVEQVQGEKEIAWADQSMMNETMAGSDLLTASESTSSLVGPDCDINAIMDFPVLSCTTLTPKTPGRKTPFRHSSGKTPVKTPQTYCLQSRVSRPQEATPSSPLPNPRTKLFADMLSTPAASQVARDTDTLVSKTISNTIQECMNVSATSSQVGSGDKVCEKVLCKKSEQHIYSGQDQSLPVHNNNSLESGSGVDPKDSCGDCGQNRCNNESHKSLPDHSMNETFTFNEVLTGLHKKTQSSTDTRIPDITESKHTSPSHKQLQQNNRQSQHQTSHSSQKSSMARTPAEQPSSTEAVMEARVNSGTVTKAKPTENSTPPNHSKVVRSIDFSGSQCPSPAGQLTFAEALKSPGAVAASRRHTLAATDSPVRSPLMAIENHNPKQINTTYSKPNKVSFAIPATSHVKRSKSSSNMHHSGAPSGNQENHFRPATDQTFVKPMSGTSILRRHSEYTRAARNPPSHMTESVRRFGLPSVFENKNSRSTSTVGHISREEVPRYMQMTKTAKNKRYHRRSMSLEGDRKPQGLAKRMPVHGLNKNKENTRGPSRATSLVRSKSAAHLYKAVKSTFF